MRLPADCVLDALAFLEYDDLVAVQFAGKFLHAAIKKNSPTLPMQREFTTDLEFLSPKLYDINDSLYIRPRDLEVMFLDESKYFRIVLGDFRDYIGLNKIRFAKLDRDAFDDFVKFGLLSVFPALSFASHAKISFCNGDLEHEEERGAELAQDAATFLAQFHNLSRLALTTVPRNFSWDFLRLDALKKLDFLKVRADLDAEPFPGEDDLVRFCEESRLARVIKISHWPISTEFAKRIVKVVHDWQEALSIKLKFAEENFTFDEALFESRGSAYGYDVYGVRQSNVLVYYTVAGRGRGARARFVRTMVITNDAEQYFGTWNYPAPQPNEEDIRTCRLVD